MERSDSKGVVEDGNTEEIDWEHRPGCPLVQKRDGAMDDSGSMIKVKVSHGSSEHEISIPAQATFGDLKRVLAHETGLEPKEQRLLFRGKEKEDNECLHMVGVKDMSKLVLMENPTSKENKLAEMKGDDKISKACEAIAKVREEVNKLSEKVNALDAAVHGGTKVVDKEFVVLTELLMVQLLKLDGIEAEGEAKVQRKIEVRRIQSFVETLDILKAKNSNPSSTEVTKDWESFD